MLPLIARGVVGAQKLKKASTSAKRAGAGSMVTRSDGVRGIQNAQTRFEDRARSRLLSEELQRDIPRKNDAEASNDSPYESTQEEESPQDQYRQEAIQRLASRKALSSSSAGIASKGAPALKGTSITTSLWVLGWVALFQFIFGISAFIGFGLHASLLYAKNESYFLQFISSIYDFSSHLPFEGFGYAFWGLNILITIVLFLVYMALFTLQGTRPFGTAISTVVSTTCLFLNFMPVTNIFPWLECWILYWLLRGIASSISPLSNRS